MPEISQSIMISGHIIDSLSLSKVLDDIIDRDGDYILEKIDIGKTKKDLSHAVIRVSAPDSDVLSAILRRLHQLGAELVKEESVHLEQAETDGVFPENFYVTSNYETHVKYENEWITATHTCMDCGILVDRKLKTATCVKMNDVKRGEYYVTGLKGVRIDYAQKPDSGKYFAFMDSGVSSEKPKRALIKQTARYMREIRESGQGKMVLVCGPAVVHTGARHWVSRLIDGGFVQLLLAGNALAVHDMEATLYGTSLGVSLKDGVNTHEGHRNHMYAINAIRAAGGIRPAVEKGFITDGIMFSCVKNNCDYVLAGSIRDDGPLPEVVTDTVAAQLLMKEKLEGARLVIMLSTMLHAISVGNMLPADVRTLCVDIAPSVVTKLSDRGSHQAYGLVMDVEAFLHELCEQVVGGHIRQ